MRAISYKLANSLSGARVTRCEGFTPEIEEIGVFWVLKFQHQTRAKLTGLTTLDKHRITQPQLPRTVQVELTTNFLVLKNAIK